MTATCSDGILNGVETSVDCGGGLCPACLSGQVCAIDADCSSNNCVQGTCVDLLISQIQQLAGATAGTTSSWKIPTTPTSATVVFDATWALSVRSAANNLTTCAASTAGLRFSGGGQVIPPHHHLLYANTSSPGYSAASPPRRDVHYGDHGWGSNVMLLHGSTVVDALCFYFDATSLSVLTGCPIPYTCEGVPISNSPHTNGTGATSNSDASRERLPGGALGNGQDSNDTLTDFIHDNPATPRDLASPAVP